MMKQSFFAVDLGATGGRIILGSFTKNGLETEEISRFSNHMIVLHGHVYWDIYELYRNIVEGLKIAGKREDLTIVSIGIDAWGVDFASVDKNGGFIGLPYAYRDSQNRGAAERFFARTDRGRVYASTGTQVMDINTLFQIDTMRQRDDVAYKYADKFIFLPDALSYMLTGKMVTEYTIASTSNMRNAPTQRFDPKLLAELDLDENRFPPIVYPGFQIGTLNATVQHLTGLGAVPVIAVAGHDTASAVAAVPTKSKKFAYLSSGSWSLMGIEVDSPIITPEAEAMNFTNEGGVEGRICVLKNICALWILERCRATWASAIYEELFNEALETQPFRSLINPDDKRFAAPANMISAIKEYCIEHGEAVPRTHGEFVRCILESIAMRYRNTLDKLRRISPHKIETLHIIGGGSRNTLLNQWTADACNIEVVAGPAEATSIGNIMMQSIANGDAKDVESMRKIIRNTIDLKIFKPQNRKAWNEAYERFLKLEA